MHTLIFLADVAYIPTQILELTSGLLHGVNKGVLQVCATTLSVLLCHMNVVYSYHNSAELSCEESIQRYISWNFKESLKHTIHA